MTAAEPCRHPGTLSVSGQPGLWWCPTCDTHLIETPDGTLTELEDRT